jgi:hypothetical protein
MMVAPPRGGGAPRFISRAKKRRGDFLIGRMARLLFRAARIGRRARCPGRAPAPAWRAPRAVAG